VVRQIVPVNPANADPERAARWKEQRRRLGLRVRGLRLEAGLTQEALALASGWSRNQIIYVENGVRGTLVERLCDLADALGVEVGDLLKSE